VRSVDGLDGGTRRGKDANKGGKVVERKKM
jgi:hypothetical protein